MAAHDEPDPIVMARNREARAAIGRALGVARDALAAAELPLRVMTGSAILADIELADGVRRRAVRASLLVPFGRVDAAVRAFRGQGFGLGIDTDDAEIIRATGRQRLLYALVESDHDLPVPSLRLPTAHPASDEGRRQRIAFVRATLSHEVAAVVSRIRRIRSDTDDASESEEFRIVPFEA
ncbi:MAG: hypothetical protein ACKOYN_13270 [Planctomycetota bacterium]